MSGLLTCPTYGSYRLHHQDMGFRAGPIQHRAGLVTGNEDDDDCTHCLKRKIGTHEVPYASTSTGVATKAATIYDVCVRALGSKNSESIISFERRRTTQCLLAKSLKWECHEGQMRGRSQNRRISQYSERQIMR